MAFDAELAERVRYALARTNYVSEKKMLGGIAFLLNGNMLVGVLKDELVVRLGADRAGEALGRDHVRAFDFTGRAMAGWVVVEPDGLDGDEQLAEWIESARAFVEQLPAK
jgi:TfoX/Sxy family transcriptional regulator of competence genes